MSAKGRGCQLVGGERSAKGRGFQLVERRNTRTCTSIDVRVATCRTCDGSIVKCFSRREVYFLLFSSLYFHISYRKLLFQLLTSQFAG